MNEARLPLLLRASPFRVRARRSSLDFQFRVGHPSAREPDGSAPCVTVLSRAADRELDRLSLSLAAKGIPMVRMDSDRCAGIDCRWDLETGTLHWDSRAFHPIVFWRRYFAMEAVALPVGELAHYGREQWAAWAMMLCGSRTHRINAAAEPGRPDRLAQLDAARRAGLRTPATAVGTRTADAAALIPGRADLIVKSLGAHAVEPEPGRLRGIFPRRVTRAELSAECAVGSAGDRAGIPHRRRRIAHLPGGAAADRLPGHPAEPGGDLDRTGVDPGAALGGAAAAGHRALGAG